MDIPLSSDALDIAQHPDANTHLLATGLVSGKVQLINYSPLAKQSNGSSANANARQGDGEESGAESNGTEQGRGGSRGSKPASRAPVRKKAYSKPWTVRPSSKSCRGVAFDQNGTTLYSIAKDGSIVRLDTETGSTVSQWTKAHETAPSRLLPIDANLLATGDDDGVIKLWDPRRPSSSTESGQTAVASYDHHFDWITSMLWCSHLAPPRQAKKSKEEQAREQKRAEKKRRKKTRRQQPHREAQDSDDDDAEETRRAAAHTQRERLVCTSGDGTLSVIDVRAGSKTKDKVDVSEDQEDELLSLASVKRGSKLVVGTQLGILSLWAPSKGLLDHVDRVPGHPASVDAMCTLDDDTVLTGSSDGLVRVVQIMPHKLLGVVADHGGMPVERIARHGNWLASIGHGPEVKLTDLAPLLEDDDGEGSDDDEAGGVDAIQQNSRKGRDADSDGDGYSEDDAPVKERRRLGSERDLDSYDEGEAEKPTNSESESEPDSDSDSDSDSDASRASAARHPPSKRARAALAATPAAATTAALARAGTRDKDDFFADL